MFRGKMNVTFDAVLTVNIVSPAKSLIVCCTHFTGKIAFVTSSGMGKNSVEFGAGPQYAKIAGLFIRCHLKIQNMYFLPISHRNDDE